MKQCRTLYPLSAKVKLLVWAQKDLDGYRPAENKQFYTTVNNTYSTHPDKKNSVQNFHWVWV